MKQIFRNMFSLAGLFAVIAGAALSAGCDDKYEQKLTLAVDQEELTFPAAEWSSVIMVYSTGSWKASFPDGVTWITAKNATGNGNGSLTVELQENPSMIRRTHLTIEAEGRTKTITIDQRGAIDEPKLVLGKSQLDLIKVPMSAEISFETNMGDNFDKVTHRVDYPDPDKKDWVSNVVLTTEKLTFNVAANHSGSPRSANIWIEVLNPVTEAVTSAKLAIIQTTESGTMAFTDDAVTIDPFNKTYTLGFATNLGDAIADIDVDVEYEDGVAAWISEVTPLADKLTFVTTENGKDAERVATVTLSYTDPDDTAGPVTASVEITQKILQEEVSFADLRAMISGASGELSLSQDFIQGVVIASGAESYNVETNPTTGLPTGANAEFVYDYTDNTKTAYIQTADGSLGFRVKMMTEGDNILERGSNVSISLSGLTLVKDAAPERYTLKGFTADHVIETSEGTLVDKQKAVSELVDADVYTFVTIKNVEMPLNVAPYMVVPDHYVANSVDYKPTYRYGYTDCAPKILRDNTGAQIKMLINAMVPWRRKDVPTGSGTVSGVLVHSKLTQYAKGGDIGRYQIRPLVLADVNFTNAPLSTNLVVWNYAGKGPSNSTIPKSPTNDLLPYSGDGQTDNAAYIGSNTMTTATWRAYTVGFSHTETRTTGLTVGGGATSSAANAGYGNTITNANGRIYGPWWKVTGGVGTPGDIFIAFSAKDVTKPLWLTFAIGGGNQNANSYQIPVNWDLQYSVDDGEYVKFSQFIVRPIATTTQPAMQPWTPAGTIEYAIDLPAAILGKEKVVIKLIPADNKCVSAAGEEAGTLTATAADLFVRFDYVAIKYNN